MADVVAEFTCVVCAESADVKMSAECNWCDGRYHLNQRNDVDGKDCGQVWIDEQYLALQFACNNCLAADDAPIPPSDVSKPKRIGVEPGRPRRYKRRA